MARAAVVVRAAQPADLRWLRFRYPGIKASHLRDHVKGARVLIAMRPGRRIGFLQFSWFWSRIPYIDLIHVDPVHRRQGAGRALLAALEDRARRMRASHIMSSSQSNEPEPQAWHRHMSFVRCGRIDGINPDGSGEVFFLKEVGNLGRGRR